MATRSLLRTQLQIAERRAAAIARAAARREFERRYDAASYHCHKDGASWIAEGPANQRFDYSKTDTGDVLCLSSSGGIYLLTVVDGETVWHCDCPAAQKAGSCKHETGFSAIRMAHRMERQEVRAELHTEAEELNRLRAEGEDTERAVRAEWAVANGAGWQAPEWEQDAREAGIEGLLICERCDGLYDGAECPCAYRDYYPGEE